MSLVTAASVAIAVSFLLTLPAIYIAHRCRFVDKPDGHHKVHPRTVALGGGIVLLISTLVAIAVSHFINPVDSTFPMAGNKLAAFLAGCLLITTIGLYDDRYKMRGRHKLIGQVITALVLVGGGWSVHNVQLIGYQLDLGLIAVPLTIMWLVGIVNSINLIDGLDGVASTVGMVMCITIAILATIVGRDFVAVIAIAMAGGLLGFLPFNFPTARMFLGDAGSMLVGLVVGALALECTLQESGAAILVIPIAICTIPIFDTVAAVIRRKLTGRSIYTTDHGHLHHRLLHLTGKTPSAVGVMVLCSLMACGGAITTLDSGNEAVAIVSSLFVIGLLVALRIFGYVELLLLLDVTRSALDSVFSKRASQQLSAHHLQGSGHWNTVWDSLMECTEKLNLNNVQLDINLPAAQESFHASWQSPMTLEPEELWWVEFPLFVGGRTAGTIRTAGHRSSDSSCEAIWRLVDLLQPFESQLEQLADAQTHRSSIARETRDHMLPRNSDIVVEVATLSCSDDVAIVAAK